ncbi:hypothetical protein M513_07377 [Trichuris suis]|uniref:Dystroglycan 1 n=1 Tax=Trichuris suis TaxID=68888 RepID=A0A085M385_9BILA|nr:hypothetical protein M513_07377 [Trichuris suis]
MGTQWQHFKLLLHTVFVFACLTSKVRIKNGLPDVTASVGQLFNYTLPRDAFEGSIRKYKVTEAGSDHLPRWLRWDEATGALVGVPTADDAGPSFIAVSAYGTAANGTRADYVQDVFSMDVHSFDVVNDGSCATSHLLIVLNCDLMMLSPNGRISLLRSAADQWLNADIARLRLLEWQDVSPALADVTLSGNTDLATLRPSLMRQAVLLWTIGCERSFSLSLAEALTSFRKRLDRQPSLAPPFGEGKNPIGTLYWAVVRLKRYHRKRQVDQERDVQSKYASVGYNTDIYGETNWYTPTPQRPWLSIRPTSRIDHKSSGATSMSSTRVTASVGPTEDVEEPASTRSRFASTVTARPKANSRPEVRKSLGTVVCYKGVVCEVRIPDDTFYDVEDGSTVTLRLSLDRLDDQSQPEWMYLDTLDRTLFGLSLETGQWQYSLTANDSSGSAISDAFAIRVLEAAGGNDDQPPKAPNHRVRLAFAEDLKYLRQRPSNFVKLIRRLAEYFGEADASAVLVHKIEEGSTVVVWSNRTLLREKCPRGELGRLIGRMRRKDGQPRREFVSFMRPEFTPVSAALSYEGACEPSLSKGDSAVTAIEKKPSVTSEPDDSGSSLMSTLLPAVIILLLLIIAGIISCVYYRRNRRAGKHHEDTERKYLSKGTPIIFPDEVDAENECNATSPMLLKEEKPPLHVTELSSFQPNNMVASSTPRSDTADQQKPLAEDGTTASNGTPPKVRTPVMERTTENPLYRPPPPPFDSNRLAERSPKPKHGHPAFREPPPYVPP